MNSGIRCKVVKIFYLNNFLAVTDKYVMVNDEMYKILSCLMYTRIYVINHETYPSK